jgi:hypothetical protein
MTSEKLIDKFRKLLSLEKKEQMAKRDKLRELLKKLKKQQAALEAKLEVEKRSDDRKQIKRRLKVIQLQRKKGIKLCKSINCKR